MDEKVPPPTKGSMNVEPHRALDRPSANRMRTSSREFDDPESLQRRSLSNVSPGLGPPKVVGGKGDFEEYDDDGHIKRTGTVVIATAHIVTAVIGSGVLSLPSAMAGLGWVGGIATLMMFACVTWYTTMLLSDCYRYPTPRGPVRNYTYMDAVRAYLKPWQVQFCGAAQYANLIGTGVGYTITASTSLVAITRSNCFHANNPYGADPNLTQCTRANNPMLILFGCLQLVASQIPDLDRIWWLSIVAAIMSFGYSLIGLGLSIAKVTDWRNHPTGTVGGLQIGIDVTGEAKAWLVSQSLGNIAFAYSFSMILIEIADTIRDPPAANTVMKHASHAGIGITTFFYMTIGVFGFAAFGDGAPGNLLTGFGFFEPFWLIDIANIFIFVHLLGAYQIYTQPYFFFMERTLRMRFPKSTFLLYEFSARVPGLGFIKISPFRLLWRSLYVVLVTVLAALLPFFNDILGILGSIGFWPLTVYFPVEMHIAQNQIPMWSKKWCWLQALSLFCFCVSAYALIGVIVLIVGDVQTYVPFHSVSGPGT